MRIATPACGLVRNDGRRGGVPSIRRGDSRIARGSATGGREFCVLRFEETGACFPLGGKWRAAPIGGRRRRIAAPTDRRSVIARRAKPDVAIRFSSSF